MRYLLVALLLAGCGGSSALDDAEGSCARYEGTETPEGCDESAFDACVRCYQECRQDCVVEPVLKPCLSETFLCAR